MNDNKITDDQMRDALITLRNNTADELRIMERTLAQLIDRIKGKRAVVTSFQYRIEKMEMAAIQP